MNVITDFNDLIGQQLTEELRHTIEHSHQEVRFLDHDAIITQENRPERLNVYTKACIITKVKFG